MTRQSRPSLYQVSTFLSDIPDHWLTLCREKPAQNRARDAKEGATLHVCNLRPPSGPSCIPTSTPVATDAAYFPARDVPARRQRLRTLLRQRIVGYSIWKKQQCSRVPQPWRVKCTRRCSRSQTICEKGSAESSVRTGLSASARPTVGTSLPSNRCKQAWASDPEQVQLQVAPQADDSQTQFLQ